MKIDGRDYQALWQEGKTIQFIDQRKLPYKFEIYTARTVDDKLSAQFEHTLLVTETGCEVLTVSPGMPPMPVLAA